MKRGGGGFIKKFQNFLDEKYFKKIWIKNISKFWKNTFTNRRGGKR
jgi:hypothetical protein